MGADHECSVHIAPATACFCFSMSSTHQARFTAATTTTPGTTASAQACTGTLPSPQKLPAPRRSPALWDRWELPTLALALALYAAWAALVWWHAQIPGLLLFVLGGYVAQLHFSLQHESIHAMRHWPAWLRTALVWPPINLWLPYPLYHASHSTHHVNAHLTHPQRDTESAYHHAAQWHAQSALWRAIYRANQILPVRLLLGPFLRLYKLVRTQWRALRSGNLSLLAIWGLHAISAIPLLYFVLKLAGMPWWQYLLYFVYPGMVLGQLRTFTEHRWGHKPVQRTAIVESNVVGGVLYLYNNQHLIHHLFPTLPWYHIPRYFREHRQALLHSNGGFYYRGYAEIAQRFWRKPVFDPVHPHW